LCSDFLKNIRYILVTTYSLTRKDRPSTFAGKPANSQNRNWENRSLRTKNARIKGCFKEFLLADNIQCLYTVFKPKQDLHLNELPVEDSFVLRIDEISRSRNSVTMVGRKYNFEVNQKSLFVTLLSPSDKFTFFSSKNSTVNTLEILIPSTWFLKQLKMDDSYALLKKYLAGKTRKPFDNLNDQLLKKHFSKIIDEAGKRTADRNCIQTKISSLLSICLEVISADLSDFLESEKVKISGDEINRLITLRKYLDTNISEPTLNLLTKIALMSTTSLKSKFKKMYGSTVFEYFQSMRMQKARILLLTQKYSVKQIGQLLGYSNMSNFAIAFKKQFDQLPHELIK
jgi:AraC-like DNA-binding protein